MKRRVILAVAAVLSLGAVAHGQTSIGGSLALTGEVDGSIAVFIFSDPAGYNLSIDGLTNESMDIGDISAYAPDGLLANKFTKTLDSDGFHVTTPFQMQVVSANLSSSGYTLTAHLGDDDSTVWKVDGNVLSTVEALISATEPYSTKRPHTLYAKFPFTRAAGSVIDTITFTATAN